MSAPSAPSAPPAPGLAPLPTGAARVAGVMGWPVGHSLSPALHGLWLAETGQDGAYVPLPVRAADLAAALAGIAALGLVGVNVTLPHKETVAARLAADPRHGLTPRAEALGSVNLVTRTAAGLWGDSTDGEGARRALEAGMPAGRSLADGPAAVLGAGGAARALLPELLAASCPEIRLTNRSRDRAERLARDLGPEAAAQLRIVDWVERRRALAGARLLINATSLGMAGQPPLDIALDGLAPGAAVFDMVYRPLTTDLLAAARDRGLVAIDGLGMLIHQAVPAFTAFYGATPAVTPELRTRLIERGALS